MILASLAFDWGFSQGERALAVRSTADLQDANTCAACHAPVADSWRASAHGRAWTNDIFREGFAAEPRDWCIHCHAPLQAQAEQVKPNVAAFVARGPYGDGALPAFLPQPLADQGVGCAACHVRDNGVLSPVGSPHPGRAEPGLASGEVCRDCHQFNFHRADGTLSATAMQATWAEWEAWGGAETCVSCHMPGGDHHVRGTDDVGYLARSVEVSVSGRDYTVTSVGVGHSFPTGDLFRRLTLEERRGGAWVEIATFGRSFVEVEGPDGVTEKRLSTDTSLRPGVPRVVRGTGGPWRLRYHYGSAQDEAARRLPLEQWVVTLREG